MVTVTEQATYLSALRTPQNIQKLLAPVKADLQLVEQKMKTVETSVFAPLADAFVELIGSGGKRLRPALALLTANLADSELVAVKDEASPVYGAPGDARKGASHPGGARRDTLPDPHERLISLAAAVEMLHTATLVHDDVIDRSLLRRGAPTLNANWSQGATVLAGDYIFARAAYFSSETYTPRVIELFSETLQTIVDGELRQLMARNDFQQNQEAYYERIYAKTASLYSVATEAAAVLVNMSDEQTQQVKEFGYNFGMAFQIVDDVLDFTGDNETLGKPAGSDLRQGTLTLPFFYYIRNHRQKASVLERLTCARQDAEKGDERQLHQVVRQIVDDIRDSDAVDEARKEALDFLDRAALNLSEFPDSKYKKSLLGLCAFVVQRSS